jgi:hypothetical protein
MALSILTVSNSGLDPTAALLSMSAASATATATSTISAIIATGTVIAGKIAADVIQGSESGPKHGGKSGNGECSLFGPFALLVQGALGLLAMLSLVWKRYRERPQRPLKIWFFDASKQVFGSVLVHIANILMSMLSAGQFSVENAVIATTADDVEAGYTPNPCSFYLINLAIDVR